MTSFCFYSLFTFHVDSDSILLSQFPLHLVHDIWWIELNRNTLLIDFHCNFNSNPNFLPTCMPHIHLFNPRFSLWVCVLRMSYPLIRFHFIQGFFFGCVLAKTLPQVIYVSFRGNFNRMPQIIINSLFRVCTLHSAYVCFLFFFYSSVVRHVFDLLYSAHTRARNWNAMRINE